MPESPRDQISKTKPLHLLTPREFLGFFGVFGAYRVYTVHRVYRVSGFRISGFRREELGFRGKG